MKSDIGIFGVEYTLPAKGEERRYAHNIHSNVLTTDIIRAIGVVTAKHSDAVIHSVHRLSSRNNVVIVDPDIME